MNALTPTSPAPRIAAIARCCAAREFASCASTAARERLTCWTDVRCAPANDEAANRCAAGEAGLPLSLVHGEPLLHRAIAIRPGVVVDRRAARLNRLAQHADDRGVESLHLIATQRRPSGKRMEVRSPERLIGVDVPEAGDAALIEQRSLQTAGAPRKERAEQGSGEARLERLGAVVGEEWHVTRIEA